MSSTRDRSGSYDHGSPRPLWTDDGRRLHQPEEHTGPSTLLELPGLSVHSMSVTEPAELLQLESILGIRLVLGRDVIPPLALGAGKRQRRSLVGWHCVSLRSSTRCSEPEHLVLTC
jgi:hypothetical protein